MLLGTLEKFLGHSGRGSGTQERPWSTTRNQESRHYLQLVNLPLLVLCGNRPDGAFPTSSLSGARFAVVASSVLCGSNGQTKVLLSIAPQQRASAVAASARAVKRKLARNGGAETDDKSPMKTITPELVTGNLVYFSWRHMCRKIFPCVHRNLTLAFKQPGYVLSTDFRSMCKIWRNLTEGLRRQYMKDHDTASRTWFGVYVSSGAFPAWVKSVVGMSHFRAIQLAQPSGERMVAPLYKALEDSFTTTHFSPLSFHSQLEALYVFMAQKCLDINTMILSCFALHTIGLQNNCDLQVLALACLDEKMTVEQQLRYDCFCALLLDKVAPEDGSVKSCDHEGLLHSGYFKDLSLDTLMTSCAWTDTSSHTQIKSTWAARQLPVLKEQPSVYLGMGVDVVAYELPEAIQNAMDIKKGTAGSNKLSVDPLVCGSAPDMLAQLFASQMTDDGELKRVKYQGPLRKNHELCAWWATAVNGTRLPGKLNKSTSDKFNIEFIPPYETGFFFNETIRNIGTADGVIRHSLMMFGLHEDCSRTELLKAILGPYLRRKGITTRNIPTGGEWKNKIIGGTSPCFRFGFMPHAKTNLDAPAGVQAPMGIDVVWFIIAQALYCKEWRSNSEDNYTTVCHQRNMGGQSEALCMLLLHTQVDKAMIPACTPDGHVLLGQVCVYI